jgi:hypothetical protein
MNDNSIPLNDEAAHRPESQTNATAADPGESDDAQQPVEASVAAFLDFLEGLGPFPTLNDLSESDHREADQLFTAMAAARGIDPDGSTPSVEQLLAGTELESLLEKSEREQQSVSRGSAPGNFGGGSGLGEGDGIGHHGTRRSSAVDRQTERTKRIETALNDADPRVAISSRAQHKLAGPAVSLSYLDLRAVFIAVGGTEPPAAGEFRRQAEAMFAADDGLSHIGLVADDSPDLLTQVVSCSDLGPILLTPSDLMEMTFPPVLPAPDALRRMLELAAPIWEPFVFEPGLHEPLQLQTVVARATQQTLASETSRPYRGEKGRAYKSFVNAESAFGELLIALAVPGTSERDVSAALERVMREAA